MTEQLPITLTTNELVATFILTGYEDLASQILNEQSSFKYEGELN
ncbi:hypothetical protein [Pontibacillus halophilus]|nr:hypothetical protein [Pontibacillus halophilus]